MLVARDRPGLHTFYDRTIAYQAGRDSPFSIWGQVAGLEPLRIAILVAVGALAIAFAFRPKAKTLIQVAALGAALLIGLQLTAAALVLPLHRLVLPLLLVAMAGESSVGAGTMTCSIESASPSALTSTTAPITQTSSSAVSNLTGIWVISASSACSGLTPSTLVREPVMPTSEMKAVPAGQHPGVGGRHVGVGAEDGGDAAVEVPAHRDLLAGHLGVEVDDDARRPRSARGSRRPRGRAERATCRPTAPLRLITPTRIPPASTTVWPRAGVGVGVVGRADHPLGAVEEVVDLAVAVDVVAGGDHVGAGVEEVVGGLLGDPHPAGRVLAVDDDQVRP